MFDKSKWLVLSQRSNEIKNLTSNLNVTSICAKLLINRGYTDLDSAKSFLNKSDAFLYDPYLLKDMKEAVARVKKALSEKEKITIYGDYDVDGITAVSILYKYLNDHGGIVSYYIPTRDNEGYGLSCNAIDAIKSDGTKLIITVDTGVTGIDEAAYAQSCGVDMVITDHHECKAQLPQACAVVNPRRFDDSYPYKGLSGVGVAFKMMCAMELNFLDNGVLNNNTIKEMCKRYIDLVTIGTIADVMPLTGENRIIVYMGLNMITRSKQPGINAIFNASRVPLDGETKITSSTISYTIAPKINAVGRMSNASKAVELFLSDSQSKADLIAEELCEINRERQATENKILVEALEMMEKDNNLADKSVIVLSSSTWHHGVVGIVASRLVDRFNKPAILISFDGNDDEGKGSARSVKGFNLVNALAHCEGQLVKFGGHELAAGLTIRRDQLEDFAEKLNEYVAKEGIQKQSRESLTADCEIKSDDVTESIVSSFSSLEPFGCGNPEPLFCIRNCRIISLLPLSEGKHTKVALESNSNRLSAVMFGINLQKEGFAQNDMVDIVFNMDINEYRGIKSVQLRIKDIDYADSLKFNLRQYQSEVDRCMDNKINFSEEYLPSPDDFKSVYCKLTESLKNKKGRISIKKIIVTSDRTSYIKTGAALVAFQQAEVFKFTKINEFDYEVELLVVKEKPNLNSTPIMVGNNVINVTRIEQ
ncbi:MAG: single-stranded-DNA-specific exonuclease RecJ [Clostridiales bacterium]|nr:single-stranded-DNA-specific exonuclease RecJ [Clostridiales bacterium]